MQLQPISYINQLPREEFNNLYAKTKTPVVIRNFMGGSPAFGTWNYDYFRKVAGNKQVAVHGGENAHLDKASSLPAKKMPFAEYLDIITKGPTESRLFLFNLLMERPELRKDMVITPPLKNFLSGLPFLFFGGEGSSVRYHYDIDMSHVFLTQFEGQKRILLFPNDQSPLLYRLPHNFHGLADLRHPDYEKFPALKFLKGYECILQPGETLFMPSGFWHYIQYTTQGYSVAHRALSASFADKAEGFWNVFIVRRYDTLMRKLLGKKWFNYKQQTAFKRANRIVKRQKAQKQAEQTDVQEFGPVALQETAD